MTHDSIIGTGNMGRAIAGIVIAGGNTVEEFNQSDGDKALAGDDKDAKALLADVVSTGGLRAIDAGSLSRARELEAPGFLQLTLAVGEKIAWTGGFAVVA